MSKRQSKLQTKKNHKIKGEKKRSKGHENVTLHFVFHLRSFFTTQIKVTRVKFIKVLWRSS